MLQDADVVFVSCTAFNDDLMKAISKKCEQLKPGARIITLTRCCCLDVPILSRSPKLPIAGNLSTRMQMHFKRSIANTAIAALDQPPHLFLNGQILWH